MSGTSDDQGYAGAGRPQNAVNDYDALSFVVEQMIQKTATAVLVLVKAVTGGGGAVALAGSVDVQVMTHQTDGRGQAMPHGIIHGMPYFRLQGGANAVILDPQVGDIGVAVICTHDISTVKATSAVATPGSRRRFDLADGLYLGGFLNAVPTQYVDFTGGGVTVVSPNAITVQAPTINLTGNVASTGTFTNNGHNIGSSHVHTQVQSGGANSGPPP